MKSNRPIDWIASASRSIRHGSPADRETADYVAERLAALMFERLDPELGTELLELLPDEARARARSWRSSGPQGSDRSVGFPTFVERTHHALGLSELLDSPDFSDSEEAYGRLCETVTESFLWAMAYELPAELKERMRDQLPLDLRSRMNLFTAHSDEEQVA